MKIATWNVNGVPARSPHVLEWLAEQAAASEAAATFWFRSRRIAPTNAFAWTGLVGSDRLVAGLRNDSTSCAPSPTES
jgi:hypothetical protein